MRGRLGLAPLMALIAALALGLAAMKAATDLAAGLSLLGSSTLLLLGTLGAILRNDRAAWIGFALFGWAYVGFAAGMPMVVILSGSQDNEAIWAFWPIEKTVEWAADRLHPNVAFVYPPVVAYNVRREGGRYYRSIQPGGELSFSDQDRRIVDDYLDHRARYEAWQRSAFNATRAGLAFQGLFFAGFGALAGQHLGRDPAPRPGPPSREEAR